MLKEKWKLTKAPGDVIVIGLDTIPEYYIVRLQLTDKHGHIEKWNHFYFSHGRFAKFSLQTIGGA